MLLRTSRTTGYYIYGTNTVLVLVLMKRVQYRYTGLHYVLLSIVVLLVLDLVDVATYFVLVVQL